MSPSDATLLGSSVGNIFSISSTISEKTSLLKTMGGRLQHLSAHYAILLLRHSCAIPKLLHILRTSPCFSSPALKAYDEELRSILSAITNIHLEADSPSWSQATLPVSYDGLGVRSAVQLSTSAFLASIAASSVLVGQILPSHLHVAPPPLIWLRQRFYGLRTMTNLPLLPQPLIAKNHGTPARLWPPLMHCWKGPLMPDPEPAFWLLFLRSRVHGSMLSPSHLWACPWMITPFA